jgi:predicted lipoprotein with Yx(FWY)xxD motif
VAGLALAASGLAGASTAAATSAHAAQRGAPAPHHGVKVSLRHTAKGKVLVGPNGHSLYDFSRDTKNHSNCDSTCRIYWHLLKSKHKPRAGTGVKQRLLGRTSTHQVTYRGKPLYYYVGDTAPGDILGEGSPQSGGVWYLVNAKGKSVR